MIKIIKENQETKFEPVDITIRFERADDIEELRNILYGRGVEELFWCVNALNDKYNG